ncbi:MAG: putative metal-binding motif-containing protein [Deltaproteobacteria bacterium]|nr:putative metal-binding motif-containing protein [Deltaproteobacteria bacterium]
MLAATSCATGWSVEGDVGRRDGDAVDGVSEDGPGDFLDDDAADPETGAEDGGGETVCGPPGVCDDHVSCTEDSCDPVAVRCVHVQRGSLCDDGDPCTGAEVCDVVLDCIPGTPVDCDDGLACTDDSCLPATGGCEHVLNCTPPQICDPAGGGCTNPPTCSTDADCDDGNLCTGVETCSVEGMCRSGTPAACEDGLACSLDRCDPAAAGGRGACVAESPDLDGDRHGSLYCLGDDCDDADGSVFPGAMEICNATDDDCDGATDETFACARGTAGTCSAPGGCVGVQTCGFDCTWGACTVAGSESCNGLDDNCNGSADETFACVLGAGRACSVGAWSGSQTCVPGCTWGACVVTAAETCNGVDDDCNGSTDETFTCVLGANRACSVGACGGTQTCQAGCTWSACVVSGVEACNGSDDDCDGATDETFACTFGATRSCTVGSCTGSQSCGAGCTWSTCAIASSESCNGVDDDCDGTTDEGYTCPMGSTLGCTNSCGAAGWQTCAGPFCTWGGCCSPLEVCGNACDDDCDTAVNEGCGATCSVVEGFEAGYWPAPGWSGGIGTVGTGMAHDGSYGIQDPDWPYRTDVVFGNAGDRMTAWVRPGDGRAYIGFAASAGGCKSFVAAPNTTDIRFQDNAGWGFEELNYSTQSFAAGTWYLMEVEFYAGDTVTGRLYAADGTTLLNSVTQTFSSSVVGGLALRTFGAFAVDTISVCRP